MLLLDYWLHSGDRQAGCVLYIQHKIAKAMEADERKCRNEKHV